MGSVAGVAQSGLATHLGQGAVHAGGYHAAPHAVVAQSAPAYHAAPVVHAVPHAAPAYHAETYADEVSPYTYQYAVADDYSNSNFKATEQNDGTGKAEGSYSVALPDGRIQTVNFHVNDYDGYVAEVTYEGQAQYPVAAAPAPGYHA